MASRVATVMVTATATTSVSAVTLTLSLAMALAPAPAREPASASALASAAAALAKVRGSEMVLALVLRSTAALATVPGTLTCTARLVLTDMVLVPELALAVALA